MSNLPFGTKIKVNLSSTFVHRSRCSKCGGLPCVYYYSKLPYYHKSANSSNQISLILRSKYSKIVADYYLLDNPSEFNNLSAFKTSSHTSYKPRYHISKNPELYNGSMKVDYISCKCRKTVWGFKQMTETIESQAKKSKSTYPKKFVY